MKTKAKEKQKGITLIALVITIIVLLILAGVSIAMLTGDNGILMQASDSKIETAVGTVKEQIKLLQGEKIIQGEKVTPETLLAEGKVRRTVQVGENDKYYMYYAIKENSFEEMQGLGKGDLTSLKDVFLIDDDLNVKYISRNGKEYGNEIKEKILEDETEIRFSSKAFSEYISKISGISEEEMKFKWMKNQTTLEISDSSIDSLEDLIFFPELTKLTLKNLTLENLNGLENCIKLKEFSTSYTEVKDYMKLSKLPSLENFYVLYVKNLNFDNVLDSLKGVSTIKSFGINVSYGAVKSMNRIKELSNNLESLQLSGGKIEKIEGLEDKVNLKYLNLSSQQITKIEGLENCTKLNEVVLNGNKISKIENISNLKNLKKLNMSGNQLIDILELDYNEQLIYLNLKNNSSIKPNRSDYTEQENIRLDKIQEIITERNGEISINEEQLNLFRGYRVIDLSGSDISTLECIEGQTNIENLKLYRCKNITLRDKKSQEILKKMDKLKVLNLQESNVQELTAINEIKSLEELNLNGITNFLDLSQIEDRISQIKITGVKQEVIDSILNCNKEKIIELKLMGIYTKLPDISKFLNLQILYLNSNSQLTNFDIISKCRNLIILNLSYNNLHGRMIDFSMLTNLTNLNLSNNTLWSEDLENLKALKNNTKMTINLSNNSIIDATALLELNPSTRIDLKGNVNLSQDSKDKLKAKFGNNVTF